MSQCNRFSTFRGHEEDIITLHYPEKSGTDYSVKRCHIPEELYPQCISLPQAVSGSYGGLNREPYLVKKFPAFYGTLTFLSVSARTLHWSLSRVRLIQYGSCLVSVAFTFAYLRLHIHRGLFPSVFLTKLCVNFLCSVPATTLSILVTLKYISVRGMVCGPLVICQRRKIYDKHISVGSKTRNLLCVFVIEGKQSVASYWTWPQYLTF